MLDQSTICAISTPPGIGGIAVIRLSGKEAISIADKIFESPTNNKRLADQKANTLHFGVIKSSDEFIDEVVVSPVSYTHLRAHETRHDLVCRLLLEKKKKY